MSARELFTVPFGPIELIGTHHAPPGDLVRSARAKKTGFLFLNPGHVPRDGHGGLAVLASETLAARGFPCFRVDLPGLGDAQGALPVKTEELYEMVTFAAFAEPVSAIVREIARRWELDGLVLGGLCGASVHATFAAEKDPALVAGLALFEPEFYLTERSAKPKSGNGANGSALPRVMSYWGWMRVLTRENKYAKYMPLPRETILRLLRERGELPDVTNVPLVTAWQKALARGVPALAITAQGKLREVFFDRINHVVLSGVDTSRFTQVRITGTNHIFTTGGAIARVVGELDAWAARTFGG